MILLIQRVKKASVEVNASEIASISTGILAYVGVEKGDTEQDIQLAAKKLSGIRIFEDSQERMSLSASEKDEFLLISQFTLCGNLKKGFRPDFMQAEKPEKAKPLFNTLCSILQNTYHRSVQTGEFGADMQVHSQVDGPVTIYFNTRK